jgi:alkanesulfonate monooxygenase SsuD/methylene tetrahydromethanopterin reductase-like flavin-dependent oxidoreductase (luciferase family)
MERTPTALGPTGLFLPTFVQDTAPLWAPEPGRLPVADDAGSSAGRLPSPADPVAHLTAVCRGAEQLGADALWACDHLFWHGPSLECMVTLAIAATATDRCLLGTAVLQLPLRQAPAVAKQTATLQTLTQGRIVLGVGVGSHQGEYEQAGIDYRSRGRQLDAGIAELRRSWATGQGATTGDTTAGNVERYRQLPEPPRVPVWVGGSSEAALRRAARMADGWMPLYLKPPEYGDALDRLSKEVERAGRSAGAVTASIVLFVSIDDDTEVGRSRGTRWMSTFYGLPSKAFDRHLVYGTAREVADVVSAYRRAGAEHVGVYVTDDQPLEQFERLVSALPATGAS